MEVFRGESALTPKNVVRRVRKIQKIAESNVLSEKLRQHRKGFARRCPKAPYAKIKKTTSRNFPQADLKAERNEVKRSF